MKIQIRDNLPKNPSQNLKLKYPGVRLVACFILRNEFVLMVPQPWAQTHQRPDSNGGIVFMHGALRFGFQ